MTRRIFEPAMECWAHCPTCDVDFRLSVVVPAPLEVYIAAMKASRCPLCHKHKGLQAYSPGVDPITLRQGRKKRREQTDGFGFGLR